MLLRSRSSPLDTAWLVGVQTFEMKQWCLGLESGSIVFEWEEGARRL